MEVRELYLGWRGSFACLAQMSQEKRKEKAWVQDPALHKAIVKQAYNPRAQETKVGGFRGPAQKLARQLSS